MTTKHKILLPFVALGLLTGCTANWQAANHYDDFTNTKVCRVERGTQAQRDFTRGFTGIYFTQQFYAENRNGEIRAGVRTEPDLPIGGDIQIKVGEKLYTLTANDTPLDVAPTLPDATKPAEIAMGKEYAQSIKDMTANIQKISSPYRAYTGQKAKQLLRDIVNTGGEIKFRVVGVNSQISGTGSFKAGDDFKTALTSCGIKL